MEEHTFKISVPENMTFSELMEERIKGGRFIFFTYLIPRPWSPIKRVSKIYFLRSNDKASDLNFRYNLITLLWGWWGLPMGPTLTYTTIKSNQTGVDITEDVYDNLIKEDYEKRIVIIRKASNIFIYPSKSTSKEFYKCFQKFNDKQKSFTEDPISGYYIDTETPYYFIGLHKLDIEKSEELKKELYKYFFKNTRFEIVDINQGSEITDKLKSQGMKIQITGKTN